MCIRDRKIFRLVYHAVLNTLTSQSAPDSIVKDMIKEPAHQVPLGTEPVSYTHLDVYKRQTYGCQMNESDTERISGQLEELGYVPADIDVYKRQVLDQYHQEGKGCRGEHGTNHGIHGSVPVPAHPEDAPLRKSLMNRVRCV